MARTLHNLLPWAIAGGAFGIIWKSLRTGTSAAFELRYENILSIIRYNTEIAQILLEESVGPGSTCSLSGKRLIGYAAINGPFIRTNIEKLIDPPELRKGSEIKEMMQIEHNVALSLLAVHDQLDTQSMECKAALGRGEITENQYQNWRKGLAALREATKGSKSWAQGVIHGIE